jgi:hypothetical protein
MLIWLIPLAWVAALGVLVAVLYHAPGVGKQ